MGRTFAALMLLLGAVGCTTAEVPLAPAEADSAGRQFDAVENGRAAIYVYRSRHSIGGGGTAFNVYLDGRALGPLSVHTWFRADVAPGQHEVRCIAENSVAVMVAPAAGEVRYVEIIERSGTWALRCTAQEMQPDKARPAILAGRRASALAIR